MMVFNSFILLSLIATCGTQSASAFNENLRRNEPSSGAKSPEEYHLATFCTIKECPKYRLVKKYPGFEHREYDATAWISTEVSNDLEDMKRGFIILNEYFQGDNSAGMILNLTNPLMFIVSNVIKKKTMSKFLPANLRTPPFPLKSNTFFQRFPKQSLYVKSCGVIPSEEEVNKNIHDLVDELDKLGLPFNETFFGHDIFFPTAIDIEPHNVMWFAAIEG